MKEIWVVWVLLILNMEVLTNGRDPPLLSPFSAPSQSPNQPISPPTQSAASPPQVMQIIVVYKHHHLDKQLILAISLSSVALALIILSIFVTWIFCQRKKHTGPNSNNGQASGPTHGSDLTWHIRMKIALDTARGLEYLHEHCNPPVIHRDLKSSNILLDLEFNAKISDFGLAVNGSNHNKGNISLSGTIGYVAPEYLLDGKLTEKSDVYAFGVVLLELLMGRKPVEKMTPSQCQTIVTWAMPQITDRSKLPHIVDPVIKNTMDLKHLYQVAAVAVLCVQPEPSYRPLITDVLHSLVPLVPVELGGTLRVSDPSPPGVQKSTYH